jgi:hypothetical protein
MECCIVWSQCDGLLQRLLCLGVPPEPGERAGQSSSRMSTDRIYAADIRKDIQCLLEPRLIKQNSAEIHLRVQQVWIEPNSLAEGRHRLLVLTETIQIESQIRVKDGDARGERNRPPNGGHGEFVMAKFAQRPAPTVQCVGGTRLEGDSLAKGLRRALDVTVMSVCPSEMKMCLPMVRRRVHDCLQRLNGLREATVLERLKALSEKAIDVLTHVDSSPSLRRHM